MRGLASLRVLGWLGLLVFAGAAPASATTVVVDLAVDGSSDVRAKLRSMEELTRTADVSGTLRARVELVEDPVNGLVAKSIDFIGGSLSVVDLDWELDGTYESLVADFKGGTASAVGGVISATAVGTNEAEVAMDSLGITMDGGSLTAGGTVVDFDILVVRDLDSAPWPLTLKSNATLVTTPGPAGRVDVSLHIPLAEAVPVQPPFLVTYLHIDGVLALSGTSPPTSLPASPHPLWLGACLLGAGWLAERRRRAH